MLLRWSQGWQEQRRDLPLLWGPARARGVLPACSACTWGLGTEMTFLLHQQVKPARGGTKCLLHPSNCRERRRERQGVVLPPPFTSCGITFPSFPIPHPGITETLLLAPCVAHGRVHACGRRQRSSPQNDSRSKERATCHYSNQDALSFRGIKASAAGFTPLVQVDDVAVTRSGFSLKKPPLVFPLLSPGQRLPRTLA